MASRSDGRSVRHGTHRQAGRQVRGGRSEVPPRSLLFEAYYRSQRVVPEADWEDFIRTLRTPLPVVIRVNHTKPQWEVLEASFNADTRWQPLIWLPGAFQCAAEQYDDALQEQCGALNKAYALRLQEAASLVPPLLLQLGASDVVLDMCSAPGSKTLETLEIMRSSSDDQACRQHAGPDRGVMVANDADAERAFELLPLITRKARHPGTIVTLVNAAKFPPLLTSDGEQVLFDRIVCDVPCSGDGTLRKRPLGFGSWELMDGISLHAKQVQLLRRGLHLLKPGGRLSYSTCSLNPLENEAVVAAALRLYGNDVRLISNPAKDLEQRGLVASPGLTTWGVPDPVAAPSADGGLKLFSSYDDVPEELRKPHGPLCETMFPPRGDNGAMLEEGCLRLDPHRIDGSGFFVAIFEKLQHKMPPFEPLQATYPPASISCRLPWRARNTANHYEMIDPQAEVLSNLADFYGLSRLPEPLVAEFNTKGRLTQLNLVNNELLQFLQHRIVCKASPLLVSVGVPLFKPLPDGFMTEVQLSCRWRPALEGVGELAPLMQKRILRLKAAPMRLLLSQRLLPMQEFLRLAEAGDVDGLPTCEDKLGGCVVGFDDDKGDVYFWTPCVITGQGLELYASREELGEPAPVLLPPLRFDIITEGAGYVIVDKAAGLRTEDVLRTLHETYPSAELVSRLDKPTSGCMLVPTLPESIACLGEQFSSRKVKKTYIALVCGRLSEKQGKIDAPLGLTEIGGGSKYRAFVDMDAGKEATTEYSILLASPSLTLVAAHPLTGRTHQIRCHFAHIGFPLVGDSKYGAAAAPTWCPRLPLHCLRVQAVDHLGQPIDGMSEMANDFAAMLDALETEWIDAAAGLAGASTWKQAIDTLCHANDVT